MQSYMITPKIISTSVHPNFIYKFFRNFFQFQNHKIKHPVSSPSDTAHLPLMLI